MALTPVPAEIESLPFPTLADHELGTYNTKAYNWATRNPYVAHAIAGQAQATYANAVYVAERADALESIAATITSNIGSALAAATAASASEAEALSAASEANSAADSAYNSYILSKQYADAIDPASLKDRNNHTGTQSVNTITAIAGGKLLESPNLWTGTQTVKVLAVTKITPSKGLSNYYNGTDPIDTAGLFEMQAVHAGITELGIVHGAVSGVNGSSMLTFYGGSAIRAPGLHGGYPNCMRMRLAGRQIGVWEALNGNNTEATADPMQLQVIVGTQNTRYESNKTVHVKPVEFQSTISIANWDAILVHSSAVPTASASSFKYDLGAGKGLLAGAVYAVCINMGVTDPSGNQLMWSTVGSFTYGFGQPDLYDAAPAVPLTVNWVSHHRSLNFPTVQVVLGTKRSTSYSEHAILLTFPQAVKINSLSITAKRIV